MHTAIVSGFDTMNTSTLDISHISTIVFDPKWLDSVDNRMLIKVAHMLGYTIDCVNSSDTLSIITKNGDHNFNWSPLKHGGDAMTVLTYLGLSLKVGHDYVRVTKGKYTVTNTYDPLQGHGKHKRSAVRRAIVQLACLLDS